MIKNLKINGFRGLSDLKINHLNHINLIAGDNNCGKTSLLEALMLLRSPDSVANVYRVCTLRNVNFNSIFQSNASPYELFLSLFPQRESPYELGVSADSSIGKISCHICGAEQTILLSPDEMRFSTVQKRSLPDEVETSAFFGKLNAELLGQYEESTLNLNAYSRFSGAAFRRQDLIPIIYLSPIAHLQGNLINGILKNDGYKDLCIRALQLFDPDITDMLLLKNQITSRSVEYLKHRKLGTMPLSSYGDGLKKVLSLANAVVRSAGGILLIDEIETSLHKKYYDDIFQFIVKSCNAFGVQIFITTHSLEAIDSLLATQEYDKQQNSDAVSVITLKRIEDKSYARILSGREAAENRDAFGFEVRL